MTQVPQDKRAVWLPNSTGSKWDSTRPGGDNTPLAHGNVINLFVSGAGTKTDLNTSNRTFAGQRYMEKLVTGFESATTPTPASNTKAGWLAHTGGIIPVQSSNDFNPFATESGATLELTGGPTQSGKWLKRTISQAVALLFPANYRLRNWCLEDNLTGYKPEFRFSLLVYAQSSNTVAKFVRPYWAVNDSFPNSTNMYISIQKEVFAEGSAPIKTSVASSLTAGQSTVVTLTFGAPITGLYHLDVELRIGSVTVGTMSNWLAVSDTVWTFTFTASQDVPDVIAATVVNKSGAKLKNPSMPRPHGYDSSFRLESTLGGSPGCNQTQPSRQLPQTDAWHFVEGIFDAKNSRFAVFVDGKPIIDIADGYDGGWVNGQLGDLRALTYIVLGNTIDARIENGHYVGWAEPVFDYDLRRIMLYDAPIWGEGSKPVECFAKTWLNGDIQLIVNQGHYSDLRNKHLFYCDGITRTYIQPLPTTVTS